MYVWRLFITVFFVKANKWKQPQCQALRNILLARSSPPAGVLCEGLRSQVFRDYFVLPENASDVILRKKNSKMHTIILFSGCIYIHVGIRKKCIQCFTVVISGDGLT